MGGDGKVGAREESGGRQEKRGQQRCSQGGGNWEKLGIIFATFCYIIFAIEMGQTGGYHYRKGQKGGIKGTGSA